MSGVRPELEDTQLEEGEHLDKAEDVDIEEKKRQRLPGGVSREADESRN